MGRHGRANPADAPLNVRNCSTSDLLEWNLSSTEYYSAHKTIWPKGAATRLCGVVSNLRGRLLNVIEAKSSKDEEFIKIPSDLAK